MKDPVRDKVYFDEEEGLIELKILSGANARVQPWYAVANDRSFLNPVKAAPSGHGLRIVRSR